jgi:hypothetical protein
MNDLLDELRTAGHAHAATQLSAKPQYIQPYIAFLFAAYNEQTAPIAASTTATSTTTTTVDAASSGGDSAPERAAAINSRTVADILVACTWIVFGGDPVESLTRLLDAGLLPSTACGQLWQSSCEREAACMHGHAHPLTC